MDKKVALFGLIIILKIQSVVSQEIAFKTREKDLIAEGIALDSSTNTFFLSSSYKNKIIKIANGKTSDFIDSDEYGFVGGIGLHVDNQNRILWACTGNLLGKYFRTGIYAFDLNSGELIKNFFFPKDTIRTLFNDIAIANNGTIYVSNTFENNVWCWQPGKAKPQKFTNNNFPFANGITLHDNNQQLYVATSQGIKMINLADSTVQLLEMPPGNITSKDLDGIAFYDNSIIGVQDDVPANNKARVVRYFLNESGDTIERIHIIDKDNPLFYGPTTLTLGNGYVYVLANSQLDNFDQPNIQIIDKKKLNPTIVIKYKLN